MFIKRSRGIVASVYSNESDFSESAYREFLLFRDDITKFLSSTTDLLVPESENQPFSSLLSFNEVADQTTVTNKEKRREALEGAQPAGGNVRA